jgi:hypothetical protein
MFTTAVLSLIIPAPESPPPEPVCVIWRRVHGCWHFFCKAPKSDVDRVILHDMIQMGLTDEDYRDLEG